MRFITLAKATSGAVVILRAVKQSAGSPLKKSATLCVAATVLFIASFVLTQQTNANQSFSIKPPPSWVKPVPSNPDAKPEQPDKESGVQYLLVDNQIRVTDKSAEKYYHKIEKVASSTGLDEVSQLKLEFEPSFQELIIHQIHIIRDGRIIDALRPREIKIAQTEDDLTKQIYNEPVGACFSQ